MNLFSQQRRWSLLIMLPMVLGLSACSTIFTDTLHQIRQQIAPAPLKRPTYQPGFLYLPVESKQGLAYMVKAFDDAGVLVWYAKPELMLRTDHGVIISARGFSQELIGLDSRNCPTPQAMLLANAPQTCVRERNLATAFKRQESIRFERPLLLVNGWQGLPGPIRVVRESVLSGRQRGNVYGFDVQGKLVFSRQWLSPNYAINVFATESAQ